jgi:hypothetical protein
MHCDIRDLPANFTLDGLSNQIRDVRAFSAAPDSPPASVALLVGSPEFNPPDQVPPLRLTLCHVIGNELYPSHTNDFAFVPASVTDAARHAASVLKEQQRAHAALAASFRSQQRTSADLSDRIQALTAARDADAQAHDQYVADLQHQHALELDTLRRSQHQTESDLALKRATISDLQGALQRRTDELAASVAECQRLEAAAADTERSFEASLARAREDTAAARGREAKVRAESDSQLAAAQRALEDAKQAHSAAMASLEAQAGSERARLAAEQSRDSRELQRTATALIELQERLQNALTEAGAGRAREENLRERLADVQAELRASRDGCASLTDKLAARDAEIASLRLDAASTADDLRTRLSAAEEAMTLGDQELTAARSSQEQLHNELRANESALTATVARLRTAVRDHVVLANRVTLFELYTTVSFWRTVEGAAQDRYRASVPATRVGSVDSLRYLSAASRENPARFALLDVPSEFATGLDSRGREKYQDPFALPPYAASSVLRRPGTPNAFFAADASIPPEAPRPSPGASPVSGHDPAFPPRRASPDRKSYPVAVAPAVSLPDIGALMGMQNRIRSPSPCTQSRRNETGSYRHMLAQLPSDPAAAFGLSGAIDIPFGGDQTSIHLDLDL